MAQPYGSGGGARGDGAHGAPYGSGGGAQGACEGSPRGWLEAHELPPTEGDAARLGALNSMIQAMGFERGQAMVQVHYKELIDLVWLLRRLQDVMRRQPDYRPQVEEQIRRLKDV